MTDYQRRQIRKAWREHMGLLPRSPWARGVYIHQTHSGEIQVIQLGRGGGDYVWRVTRTEEGYQFEELPP